MGKKKLKNKINELEKDIKSLVDYTEYLKDAINQTISYVEYLNQPKDNFKTFNKSGKNGANEPIFTVDDEVKVEDILPKPRPPFNSEWKL